MADYRLFVQRWFKEELSNDLSFVILNEVKDLRLGVTRSFAKEAQDDKETVILNEVKNLARRSKKIVSAGRYTPP